MTKKFLQLTRRFLLRSLLKSIFSGIKNYWIIFRQAQTERQLASGLIRLGNKINVYFVFTQAELWGAQSVYEKLAVHEKFEPYVVVMPNFEDRVNSHLNTFTQNIKKFRELGVKVIHGYSEKTGVINFNSLNQGKPCIVFFDQPNPGLPNDWSFLSVSKSALICYIPYGFKVANDYQGHFNQLLHNIAWRIFCETEWHLNQFKKNGRRNGENVVLSGYPKFDSQRGNEKGDSRLYFKNKNDIAKKRKVVVWAPHWSVNDSYLGYSTFDRYYEYFSAVVRARQEFFWVFRPHQRLRYHLTESGFMTQDKIAEFYQIWEESPNSIHYQWSDYLGLFMQTDALITDSGSFLAEYLVTKNPVLLLESKNSVRYNEFGEEIVRSFYNAQSSEDISSFLDDVVKTGIDPLKVAREACSSSVLYPASGSSADLIVDHLHQALF